jgi:enoyl-CoA hydratase/carnithine racemase
MVTQEKPEQATASGPAVRLEVDGPIGRIKINKPKLNLYDRQFIAELNDAVDEIRFDDSIRVVIVSSELEKVFSAGADIHMLKASRPDYKSAFCLGAQETLGKIERTPKVFLCALQGHTVGGGLEIAMACDIRIARQDAGKIGLPEIALGVLPGTGGTQRLARLVGKSRAIELMAMGRTFSFEQALEWGVINDIFEGDAESFREQILTYAKQFTTPNKAPMAVGHIKRSVQTGMEMPLNDALALERELQSLLFKSEDAKEGIAAYNEKRMAKFKNK